VLWWLSSDPRVSDEAREAISDPDTGVLVSAVSAWEMAIKAAAGKLEAPDDLGQQLEHHSFAPLAIELSHGLRAGSLPLHHTDPFDRLLIAQAEIEGLTVATRDRRFAEYGVDTLAA
jgi:PIN domain nuclease of toxin-antitoxin system